MKGEKAICPVCGQEFILRSSKNNGCSHNCYMALWREKRKEIYKKNCLVCGREFETTDSRVKYCSDLHAAEAQRIKAHERAELVPREPRECRYCGEAFIPNTANSQFCCVEHRVRYRLESAKKSAAGRGYLPKPCAHCGEEFTPTTGSAKYCCKECRTEAIRIRNSRPAADVPPPSETIPQKKTLAKLNRAAKRWATMSWDEVVRENMYYGLRYPDSQIMAYAGTLPEDYGLKRKKAKQ